MKPSPAQLKVLKVLAGEGVQLVELQDTSSWAFTRLAALDQGPSYSVRGATVRALWRNGLIEYTYTRPQGTFITDKGRAAIIEKPVLSGAEGGGLT